MDNIKSILCLFDRSAEPIYTIKGNGDVTFQLPTDFLTNKDKLVVNNITTRSSISDSNSNSKNVYIIELDKIPDLSFPKSLDRKAPFTLFNPHHSKMASRLIEILLATESFEELLLLSAYSRDRINPYMFVYALTVVLLHRPDTRSLALPSHAVVFPSLYMDSSHFTGEISTVLAEHGTKHNPIEIPQNYTSNHQNPEHRVSYFREDIGINLHHWHWHLVYPHTGSSKIVNKDRRGELFYYMHQQVIARYNFERLCNNLTRVVRFSNWRDPIEEGYFPKLNNMVANRVWPSRPANLRLSNINRMSQKDVRMSFDIEDLERWRDRIFNAIHYGFIIDTSDHKVKLTETEGINILGNLIEASDLSLNPKYYGSLHNSMHNAIAYIHDPDNTHLEHYSVMGETSTAMRDPIFYRWHAYIDDIFQEFKSTLPGYTTQNLTYDNVRVQSVGVTAASLPRNEFATFWKKSEVNLSKGLDFMPRKDVYAQFTHLQHKPFSYKIVVENKGDKLRTGTVRIFLAPKFDECGEELLFTEQRRLFIELDKFSVSLDNDTSINEITRESRESSVTIPHGVTYRNLDDNRPEANTSAAEAFNLCGCGWPENMLIPKGTTDGYQCQLFVMVSNGADDQVQDNKRNVCDDASSYCGLFNSRYPDARAMGYPFDREPRDGVVTLQQFLTPNMCVQDVLIRFSNSKTYGQANGDEDSELNSEMSYSEEWEPNSV